MCLGMTVCFYPLLCFLKGDLMWCLRATHAECSQQPITNGCLMASVTRYFTAFVGWSRPVFWCHLLMYVRCVWWKNTSVAMSQSPEVNVIAQFSSSLHLCHPVSSCYTIWFKKSFSINSCLKLGEYFDYMFFIYISHTSVADFKRRCVNWTGFDWQLLFWITERKTLWTFGNSFMFDFYK